jgi:hypothetical protein
MMVSACGGALWSNVFLANRPAQAAAFLVSSKGEKLIEALEIP